MPAICSRRTTASALVALAFFLACSPLCRAQAALLMEEPYGVFGEFNPTGHSALYFQHICAETPTRVRPCNGDEMGAVIARNQGIGGYDWVAIPLIPYLYSVEDLADVPSHVDRATVTALRNRYHEAHLLSLGLDLRPGTFTHGGWDQLIGLSYERRIYAFRFQTTPALDAALIERLNSSPNRSRFNLLYRNCADFARAQLNLYFPRAFRRSLFPDAAMTTPKQLAWRLMRYGRLHPALQLAVFEIPQIPGYRRSSHPIKSVAESLSTSAYVIPIAVFNPYLAGGIFADYLARGRVHPVPSHPFVLAPDTLCALTANACPAENPPSAAMQATGAAAEAPAETLDDEAAKISLIETKANHE